MSTLPTSDVGLATRLRQELSLRLADHPPLFYPVMRRRSHYRGILITERTNVVVEGYPRSGNTFAAAALRFAQERPVTIARHTHAPAQVMEAVRRGLPTLLLLRDPRDATLSLVIREPAVSLALALRRYLRFYSRIAPLWKGYVVATFEQVTTDFSQPIERLNARCDLRLATFAHTPENCAKVFAILEDMERQTLHGVLYETRVARPSKVRDALKAEMRHAFDSPAHRKLLDSCETLFGEFQAMSRE
jgi:hypothetical protein